MVDETKRISWFKQRRWRIALVVMMAVLVVWGGLRWDRQRRALYRVTFLPMLGEKSTFPSAINDHGQIVGFSRMEDGEFRLVLWERGNEIQDLGPLAVGGVDINNDGWIVGTMFDANGNGQAFIRDPNGTRTMLGTLGGPGSYARKINKHKQIVGWSKTAAGVQHAFVWDRIGGMVDLGLQVGDDSWADAISDAGLVFGYSDTQNTGTPFVWDPNEGMLAAPMDRVTGLYNESHAIGEHHFRGDGISVTVWRADTGLTKLFRLEPGLMNVPIASDAGQVVYDQPHTSWWGRTIARLRREFLGSQWFLWDKRRRRVRLDSYVPERRGEEFMARALNNKGCIVGALMSEDATRARPVLLEPIAERWER